MGLKEDLTQAAQEVQVASRSIGSLSTDRKNALLLRMGEQILAKKAAVLDANAKDVDEAKKNGVPAPLVNRLVMTEGRLQGMVDGLKVVAGLADPVGEVIESWTRPNGLHIQKVRVPIGVILIIYEARPEVTVDCAGLCLKSGNAAILRGGREALRTNLALYQILADGLAEAGLPRRAVWLVDRTEHEAVDLLLGLSEQIDLVIPRGGESLIRAVVEKSKIPVIKQYKGVCHVFVDETADPAMAEKICYNAKVQRPEVCNAMETLLVHERIAPSFLPRMAEAYRQAGVELRGDAAVLKLVPGVKPAVEADWGTEYLALILSVKVVGSLDEALDHIARYGTKHSEAIVTQNTENARRFLRDVDASCVYVNASTRFTDGGQFGMGAEIGISTDKVHARGPMGLRELTSYKYVVTGQGQVRE